MSYVCDITKEYSIKIAIKGAGSKLSCTVSDKFISTVERCKSLPALKVKRENEWKTWTFIDYLKDVKRFARALIKLGLNPFETINLIGFNSPEWEIAHMGSILSGCVPVGVYTTNNSDACYYVANHSKARIIVVENLEHLQKYLPIWKDKLPNVISIIIWEPTPKSAAITASHEFADKIWNWDSFMNFGNDLSVESQLSLRIQNQKCGECCCIIYTSGTTGNPKGVMLSHDNIIWTVNTVIDNFKADERERIVSYLPLSHIAAQMIDLYGPVCVGLCVYFADK